MAKKPGIPKGTRDFSSIEVARRQFIMQTIRHHFEHFGFHPIETPSFENLDTLMGKYGEEGDRLIFKILNSGDYLSKVDETLLADKNSLKLTTQISEKALRYDLTVPFARYVVMHQNELDFPFKRYQMQPVWRADRPQKGRFREFYQCDADVVGSKSLWQEVELVLLYDRVFTALGIKGVTIKLNNRKILAGIAEVIGASDKLIDFTVALDKLDKIGEEGVKNEMIEKGIDAVAIEKVQPLFNFTGSFEDKIKQLGQLLSASEQGTKGVEELAFVGREIDKIGLSTAELNLDVTLARGLNYYTGAIFEIGAPETVQMGSIGGGGRYDDLTGIFGLKEMSGVGISFGLDRIYLVMEELNLFPATVNASSKVMFLNLGEEEMSYAMKAVAQLRDAGVKTEVYPDKAKMGKQFQFADKKAIPFVVLAGSEEMQQQKFTVKNLTSGEQQIVSFEELKNMVE
ncbi:MULTISPECIES: histidine--tRNA ligase [unclassified Myroides]|uniref:histidine--tRNA ligase n=1 Tax=unclassified Myroides TaxID=2642485 RepID=UPI003D2F884D